MLEDASGDEVATIREQKLSDPRRHHHRGRRARGHGEEGASSAPRPLPRRGRRRPGPEGARATSSTTSTRSSATATKIGEVSKKWFRVRDTYGVEVLRSAPTRPDARRHRRRRRHGPRPGSGASRAMTIVWAGVIVVVVTGLAVMAMLLVRRRDPTAARRGRRSRRRRLRRARHRVLGAPGFPIFLAFTSYDAVPDRCGDRGAHRRPAGPDRPVPARGASAELTGELVCYARFVDQRRVGRDGGRHLATQINPWGVELFRRSRTVEPDQRRARRPPTASGSTRPRTASTPARTGSTAPSA